MLPHEPTLAGKNPGFEKRFAKKKLFFKLHNILIQNAVTHIQHIQELEKAAQFLFFQISFHFHRGHLS